MATVKLLSVAGDELTSDYVQYYASGWKTFGSNHTTTSMELLPGNYSFRIGYKGASNSKSQNIVYNPTVVFQTTMATVKLLSSAGDELSSDYVQYYASGWKTFGSNHTTTSMELLPGNYSFRTGLNGNGFSKSQNINNNPVVIFTDGSKNNVNNDDNNDVDGKTSNPEFISPFVTIDVYPNPFQEFTNIKFELNEESHVSLMVYDLSGKRIITLVDKVLSSGIHSFEWHGDNEAGDLIDNGVYIYRLISGDDVKTGRVIVSK